MNKSPETKVHLEPSYFPRVVAVDRNEETELCYENSSSQSDNGITGKFRRPLLMFLPQPPRPLPHEIILLDASGL
jgi:hypothetical protein